MFDTILRNPDLDRPDPPASGFFLRLLAALLIAMHLAGLVGLNWPAAQPYFLPLVPFNLVATLVTVMLAHQGFTVRFAIFCTVTFATGFFAEVIGVKTGLIFGSYAYGGTLGWKWLDVPVLLGCNWLTLIYCTGVMANRYVAPAWLRPVVASALMVLIDILIEPVAMRLDFWAWNNDTVPLQNYVGWFGISFFLQILFQKMAAHRDNPVARLAYVVQFAFFLGCNLIHWLR